MIASDGVPSRARIAVGVPVPPCDQLETLHASAVAARTGVVAFCARSGTGKSTLAASLHHRGYDLWADDAVAWIPSNGGALTFQLAAPAADSASVSLPLIAIVVLERSAAPTERDVTVSPLPGAAALTHILPHAHPCPDDAGERRQREFLLRYLHLAASIPAIRLRMADDAGRIGTVCDAVERLLQSLAAPEAVRLGR